jgi:amino acid adenylation domain-containing protein/non-ribosomal peptide synthase protein (TIGR01720 family)
MLNGRDYYDKLMVAASEKVKEKKYWLNKLSGEIVKSSFPYDFRKKNTDKCSIEVVTFKFTGKLFSKLMQLSNNNHQALYVILTAVLIILLEKYTGRNDIIVGSPIFKQNIKKELINKVLIIRTFVEEDKTFKELLLQMKQVTNEAIENRNYPVEILPEQLGFPLREPQDDFSSFPLFDVVILLENLHDKNDIEHIKTNITFSFLESEGCINGRLEFASSLYRVDTIERITNHFKIVLERALGNVDATISSIDLLADEEKKQVLYEFNDTLTDYPMEKSLQELFEEQVRMTPDCIAVIGTTHESGRCVLTYRELNVKSNQLANLLRSKGVTPDTIVGILLDRSFEMIIGILGILKSGSAYLPMNADLPENRIVSMLEDGNVSILLTNSMNIKGYSFTRFQDLYGPVNEVKASRRPPIPDFDDLPMVDRSLIDCEKYSKYISHLVKHSVNMQATRGCPYNCAYCCRVWPRKLVVRSAEDIFAEVQTYYNIGFRRFVFIDDIFNFDIKNSKRFYEMVIKNDLNIQILYPSGLRGDILTKEYIDLMIKAGTISFPLSLETASPRMQKLINKKLNLKKFRENLEYIIEKYPQVILDLNTMHGFPTETEEEAMMTLDFIKSLKYLHFPYVHILRIHTNTQMEKLALENGISLEAIRRSRDLFYHELPETLPFSKSFTLKYQAEFLNEYFLLKERLLHVLPWQMKVLTEDEIVQKYRSYLPTEIYSFDQLLDFLEITKEELGGESCADEARYAVPHLNEEIKRIFPEKPAAEDALRILLLDLSEFYSYESKRQYNVVVEPLGLMYVMTYLKRELGEKVTGKIYKSKIDFDNDEELKQLIEEFKPDLIGLRTLTMYRDFFHKTIAKIRQWGIDVPFIAGGPYATIDYKSVLQDKNIDLVIIGEGEQTFCELIRKIMGNNKKLPGEQILEKIPGIAFVPGKKETPGKFAREIIMLDSIQEVLAKESGNNLESTNNSSDLAYIIFTSGSTGKPKGVMVEHKNVSPVVKNANYIDIRPSDNVLQLSNYAFDGSVFDIYGALLNGAKLVMVKEEDLLDINKLLAFIKEEKITIFFVTTALFNILVDTNIECFAGIRNVLFGGERVSLDHVKKAFAYMKSDKIIHMYGPTETTVYATYYTIKRIDESLGTVPIGKPLSNKKVYILDKNMNIVPMGVPGELFVGGDGVARGYLNRTELTKEKFVLNPFVENDRLYRTGDLARWLPNGNIEFLDRIDSQVKLRGFRIELGEIESQLLNHEEIREAVVISKEYEDGEKYLCAYIVSDHDFGISEMREYLSRELPDYMIPQYFVKLKELPLTSNGKINRKELPEPHGIGLETNIEYIAPTNAIEKILVEIWEEVLGRNRIGVNENFFEIGGDSIRIIQIAAKMNEAGYKIEMRDFFQNPTISSLVPFLKKIERIPDQSVISGVVPLTPPQWLFKNTFKFHHHFNHSVVLFSEIGLEEEAIEAVFLKLQEHHDALRMIYQENNGNITQVNQGLDHPFSLQVFDYRNRKDATVALEAKANEIQSSIDLEKGPLMKLGLFHLDDGDRLLIVIHHVVIDGVSWRILFKDIETLYQQYKRGEPFELPPKTNSFKFWAEQLNEYANMEAFLKEKTYWMKMESQPIPVIAKDYDGKDNCVKDSVTQTFSLSRDETEMILSKVNEVFGTEINDILLTALGLALKKTFGHNQVLIALEGHGREAILKDMDITRTVGWFTAIFPVLLDVSYENDLSRQIKEIKEMLRQIPNKGTGYGILKYLTSEENKKEMTFKLAPQVSFNYLGQIDADVKQMSFGFAQESMGDLQSPSIQRAYEIEVSGLTRGKRLNMTIQYNRNQYKTETIKTLANHYKNTLSQIISHCSAKKERELTPSDFTYNKLSIEDIDAINAVFDN